jgi:DNA topoisomerase-1
MNLVIVESPAKGKTIEKYLGKGYKVLASFGHVRDLPQRDLGIDIKKDFEPSYVIPTKSKKVVSNLKSEANKAETVYLATDLDREGEAISWHLVQALGLDSQKSKTKSQKVKRITFHEITKSAIDQAIKNPRDINIALVDAQQARRVLDRLVGYKLSPFLWKKIAKGLSAGRVQSVAVRLIVEREREILNFKPEEFWKIIAHLFKDKEDQSFAAMLTKVDGKTTDKLFVKTEKQAKSIEDDLKKAKYQIADITKTEVFRNPSAPFTTSTLQMEAARKLGYSAKQTMVLAQHLYEDGLITYMRTDSVNLSKEAVATQRKVILDKYGQKYLPEQANIYQTKTKGAQEAHEAIRPTDLSLESAGHDRQENKLYELIWKRTIAAGMLPARFEQMDIIVDAKNKQDYQLTARGLKQLFDGFTRVYTEGRDDEEIEEENSDLPTLNKGDKLNLKELTKEQKFTEPPKRYTEATLVKKLEKEGIGRPSTYAPIMSTIRERGYVNLENRLFIPTEIGMMVNDLLVENFPEVVDLKFTAHIEDDFDDIALGKTAWQPVIKEFYEPFAKNLKERDKEVSKSDLLGSPDEKCPECGSELVYRVSKFGKFIACSNYPECKYNKSMETDEAEKKGEDTEPVESEEKCPKCGKPMMIKKGRFGTFLACSDYPKCKTTMSMPTGIKCPDCKEGDVVTRRTKRGKIFWGCSRYPKCKFASWEKPKA